MDTITFENIKVEGISFHRIKNLYISHQVNSHGICHIEGEVLQEEAEDLIQRVDESFELKVTTSAAEQPSRLFYGVLQKIGMEKGNSYATLILDGITTSKKLDVKKDNKTFQRSTQKYSELLNAFLGEKATVQITATDHKVGSFIIKCDETEWEFIIRMASHLTSPASTSIISIIPQIYIGIPPSSKIVKIDTLSYGSGKSALEGSGVVQSASSYEYAYLGDTVLFQGKVCRVKAVHAELKDGILESIYQFTLPEGFNVPKISNSQASGRMMTGIVKGVKEDKVQVHFDSIDKEYDSAGDWWFPYSTAYSSQDGSGWYSMPSEKDEIRVFFPSGDEGEAFAAGAVAKNVRADVTDKAWSGVNGKQILLTKDGLIIICRNEKIYIRLADDKGIEIVSEGNINVTSSANVTISAGNTVKVIAENEIIVGTAESHLNLRKEGISATGENIIIV